MAKEISNIGTSVRARLLRIARQKGQLFELVLTRYAIERLLYRPSQSPHADRFVLSVTSTFVAASCVAPAVQCLSIDHGIISMTGGRKLLSRPPTHCGEDADLFLCRASCRMVQRSRCVRVRRW